MSIFLEVYHFEPESSVQENRPTTQYGPKPKTNHNSSIKNRIYEPAFGTAGFGELKQIIPFK